MRLTAVWFMPVAAAIERVDQCVGIEGCSSSVFDDHPLDFGSPISRGRPGRGLS